MKVHLTISALLGIILLFSSPAFALQDTPFTLGPKAGVNLSNFWGDDKEVVGQDGEMKAGIVAGAFGAYAVSEWITVQVELLYAQKGAKYDDDNLKLAYIEIPMMAVMTVPTEGRFTPSLSIGPSIGFNISAKAGDEDIKDGIKTTDFGIAFGTGVKIDEIGPGAITVDVRYTLGLTNILDDYPFDRSIKNQALAIMFGFAF